MLFYSLAKQTIIWQFFAPLDWPVFACLNTLKTLDDFAFFNNKFFFLPEITPLAFFVVMKNIVSLFLLPPKGLKGRFPVAT